MNKLTQERLKELLHYDPETGVFTSKRTGKQVGYRKDRRKPYLFTKIGRRQIRLHHLAWLYMTGEMPKSQLDHINGDPTDNRWSNLRLASHFTNNWNRGRACTNKTGVKGVWIQGGKYYCKFERKGEKYRYGPFDDLELAELVIMEAREKYHGEYARHE